MGKLVWKTLRYFRSQYANGLPVSARHDRLTFGLPCFYVISIPMQCTIMIIYQHTTHYDRQTKLHSTSQGWKIASKKLRFLDFWQDAALSQGGPRDGAVHFDTYQILQRHQQACNYFTQTQTIAPQFWGCSVGPDRPCWGQPEHKPKAIRPWNYFRSIPTYVITVPKRYRQTDGRTDDMQSHNRAMHSIARYKHKNTQIKFKFKVFIFCAILYRSHLSSCFNRDCVFLVII